MARIAFLLAATAVSSLAQPAPSFEIASIKPQPWTGQGGVFVAVRGDTLSGEHASLYDLVEFAWDLTDVQLSGGPSWAARGFLASSDLYQVIAKTAGDPPPRMDQFRLMLQTLLAERFALKIHHAEKQLPVFHLVTMKTGSKLKVSAGGVPFSMAVRGGKITRITAKHASVAQMLSQVEHYTGRTVFDQTGLTGFYDFDIEFSPDDSDPLGASIFTVLQKDMGLKLESDTAAFDTVVIDHAEKPTPN